MGRDVWVTAGAPLQSGKGWRIWYSWRDGQFQPATPEVRGAAGAGVGQLTADWRPLAQVKGSRRRMGVLELELSQGTPGALYEVTIPERGGVLRWRTLPVGKKLPDEGISLLMASCFWRNDDPDGFYAAAMQDLVRREKPVLKLLMGDQVYLDVWGPLPVNTRAGLAGVYERYWGDEGYQDALAACPSLATCDDHEFWNDYPEPQKHIPYSWGPFRDEASAAAHELYDAYQAALNPGGRRWFSLSLPQGVSIFVTDMRSERTRSDAPNASLMSPAQWAALDAWAESLRGPGVVVFPQPLFKRGGSKTDRTILDFPGDAERLGAIFENALRGQYGDSRPHDIVILTGDIHTGRLSSANLIGVPGDVHEFVASPTSRVTPHLPPWGQKPSKRPESLTIGGRKWAMERTERLSSTIDNNIGLVRIAPGTNDRVRFTFQLWRVRRISRLLGGRPAKVPVHPIHDPIELQLR
jgi:hypothetical protein